MSDFRVVEGSNAERRSFTITCGLNPGYRDPLVAEERSDLVWRYTLVIDKFKSWMLERARTNKPYLTGVVHQGTVCYAYPERGENVAYAQEEPVAIISGEINPVRHGEINYTDAKVLLNELASVLGSALNQTRVYVTYRDRGWILQAAGSITPAGDKG